ncbi:flavonol synthase [Kwoniella mangroviensis CBS 8886]|nr:flavonol synthase [Kwoniella mangroviensis CBS 8886]
MAPATPFNPPSPDLSGKPHVPEWVPPPPTKETHNFAEFHSVDLSLLDSPDPKVQEDLVQKVKEAIREDGFLFLENYGVSLEQLHRQFAIAQYLFRNFSDEEKQRLLFHPEKRGTWEGYKHPYGFKRERGTPDFYEQFNFYPPEWADHNLWPKVILPFADEIEAFATYLTTSVNRRLLTLFSRVLELPDDYLWENVQSKGSPSGEGYFRHALYSPVDDATIKAGKGMRMLGHNDFGTTTLLFSVPISCLQIWGTDEQWHYVPYKLGALVINIGETLEIVSGDIGYLFAGIAGIGLLYAIFLLPELRGRSLEEVDELFEKPRFRWGWQFKGVVTTGVGAQIANLESHKAAAAVHPDVETGKDSDVAHNVVEVEDQKY